MNFVMLSLCNDGTVTMPHNTAVNLDAFWPCGVTAPACSSDRQPNNWTMPADDSSNRRADFGTHDFCHLIQPNNPTEGTGIYLLRHGLDTRIGKVDSLAEGVHA